MTTIFWFRRDLRLHDNAGLYHALKNNREVTPVFIFDQEILGHLEDPDDARVSFIHQQLTRLNQELQQHGSSLSVLYGRPPKIFAELIKKHPGLQAVYANHDYEPYAKERDEQVRMLCEDNNISFHTFKDQCIFEKDEVMKDDGKPYTVFTPYKNKWLRKLNSFYLHSYPTEKYSHHFSRQQAAPVISLETMGFRPSEISFPPAGYQAVLKDYQELRDIPSVKGTSRISVHLRFGTVSIRELARISKNQSEAWLNELVWRDFYFMILWNFPQVVHSAFKPAYDKIRWRNHEEEFRRWCRGETGYPIVDAGMRELNTTGFMHNRLRMITASFLTKHLLIDWRWGEAYFARKLLDFELASNNGGWQWAAGSGCDAAPYFRIFNPYEQTRKFDPEFRYIRQWVPEFQELSYPPPIVDHAFARERCLKVYKEALAE